jgi:hypothetical protein
MPKNSPDRENPVIWRRPSLRTLKVRTAPSILAGMDRELSRRVMEYVRQIPNQLYMDTGEGGFSKGR